ncbi:MAG: hypothetical protein H6700_02605 [Myxococcales bacterium]|nr:hypothetical protein [Myxococcales bacterium]MCB9519639.1 hypothetical protein [Myxococcales bacterium]MCB9530630.1 hypothetical protein [Myxococcales bacterium]
MRSQLVVVAPAPGVDEELARDAESAPLVAALSVHADAVSSSRKPRPVYSS